MADVTIVWTMDGRVGLMLRGVFSDADSAERFLDDLSPAERQWSHTTTHSLDTAFLHKGSWVEPFAPKRASTAATAA